MIYKGIRIGSRNASKRTRNAAKAKGRREMKKKLAKKPKTFIEVCKEFLTLK